jgi:hypothetical protein
MDKPVCTFPYQYKRNDFGKVLNPLILLPTKTNGGWQNLWYLFDSGADATMLSISLAEKLGITVNRHIKTKLYGIGEQAVYASPGEITIKIGIKEYRVRTYFDYSKESTILLGRIDIFDKFTITFDKNKKQIIFQ